jgi:hypothetical protein
VSSAGKEGIEATRGAGLDLLTFGSQEDLMADAMSTAPRRQNLGPDMADFLRYRSKQQKKCTIQVPTYT